MDLVILESGEVIDGLIILKEGKFEDYVLGL